MRLIAAVSLLLGLAQGSPSKSKELSLCKEHLLNEPEIDLYSLEISPDITRTGDEVNIRFVGKTDTDIVSLSTKLSLSILGIEVHSDTFDVCEGNAMKCPIYKGQTFEGGFRYKLPEDHPEGVDTNVRVEFITKVRLDATTSISKDLACVETDFTVKDSASASSGRFYFDDSEMKFLFNKWFKQHEDDIHIPREEMKFNKEGKHFLFTSPNRQKIFEDNLMKIAIHNAQQDKGIHTYKMGMNQFGHLTSKEFKRIFASGLRPELKASFNPSEELNSPKRYGGVFHNKPLVTPQLGIDQTNPVFSWFKTERRLRTAVKQQLSLPKEVNWVKEGAVTDVKNQGACGSCWSFATTGALEGAYFVKHRKLVSFSEQELVSCDQTDLGCDGGAMENAYLFIEQNNGLCSEVDYPYTAAMGERGLCRFNETKVDAFGRTTVSDVCKPVKGSRVQRFVDVDHTDMSLEEAVAKQPVAVGVEADETGFQFYSSGVLTSKCSQKLDHGVLVVGYGVEQDETTGEEVKYWLVKNSWGEMWGLHGYIKILRDTDEEIGGECGILLMPSYPEV